jgi:hypothetical protein
VVEQGESFAPVVVGSWVVRCYRPDDEGQLLALLDQAGDQWPPVHAGLDRSEFLRWKLEMDQQLPGHLVAEADSRLVGCLLLTSLKLKVGDQLLTATEVLEGAVADGYRGRGIMRSLTQELVDAFREGGSDVLLFQGRHSAMRKLVSELGVEKTRNTIEVLERPPFQGLRVSTAQATGSTIEIHEGKAFDARFDALWDEASGEYQLALERRHEYLNRRYCDQRGGTFRVLLALGSERLLGYAVTCVADHLGYVVDLFTLPERDDVVDALVRAALTEMDHARTSLVRCAIPSDHPYRQCLLDLGFVMEKRRVRLVALGRKGARLDWPYGANGRIHWALGDTNAV